MRAVVAHLAYISHHGEMELETDRGERVPQDRPEALLKTWHLEVSAGQYRPKGTAQHPHVHLVVKAEREDGRGRLHIDKAMLREWRQDFARMMREQGIPANATPRSIRGQTKRATKDEFYRTRQRGESYALRAKLDGVVRELSQAQTISDPARARLLKTREAVFAGWNAVAAKLEAQGEIVLGGEVRYFAIHLQPVLTDRERLAAELLPYAKERRSARTRGDDRVRDRTLERTR